jgi:hypothetical protein
MRGIINVVAAQPLTLTASVSSGTYTGKYFSFSLNKKSY